MNKGLLIQVAVYAPLLSLATIMFAVGWWVVGIFSLLGAVAAALWMRRAAQNQQLDEVIASLPDEDEDEDTSAGPSAPRG